MSGRMAAVFYSPRGQEILAAAMAANLKPTDYIVTTYRGMHDQVAKGIPLRQLFAEYYGKATGTCKGKGGPMHLTCPEKGMMVTTGIVGSSMPIATGLGWAAKLDGKNRVSVANFGDGAANIGAFHESMNMAALWKLPVVYVIENNKYGMGTSVERASAVVDLYKHGEAFGIPGEQVDGMDVVAVKAAGERAVEHARSGKGPYVLEMLTYRYRGHSMSDPGKYRTKEEVEKMRGERDPIERLKKRMTDTKAMDEAALKALDAEVRRIVADAAEYATTSPEPDPKELWTDVLVERKPPQAA
jgi:pyruvate dehydrogenase E1 component alpha subunit